MVCIDYHCEFDLFIERGDRVRTMAKVCQQFSIDIANGHGAEEVWMFK